jgi:hypothetical protein
MRAGSARIFFIGAGVDVTTLLIVSNWIFLTEGFRQEIKGILVLRTSLVQS